MRPINRGDWPTRTTSRGTVIKYVFNDWRAAKKYLTDRTGMYCHFCEMRVNNCLAVEHIKSRNDYPRLSNVWSNFLLICTSCNSNKLAAKLTAPYRQHYYWPHINNTFLVFDIPLVGPNALCVTPRVGLHAHQQIKAQSTIDLYGLDKKSTSTGDSDNRYMERAKATKLAIDRKIEYIQGAATIPAIVDMAVVTGFFSVWLDVFNDIPLIKSALLQEPEFKIDVAAWFDANQNPIPRNLGSPDPI